MGANLVGGSANQSIPYALAVDDLREGEKVDAGSHAGYDQAIRTLEQLEALPDAIVTDAEETDFEKWTAELDTFFRVPASADRVECFQNVTSASEAAAQQWLREPVRTVNGVARGPLKQAMQELRKAPADTPCYAAAIDDLYHLERARDLDVSAATSDHQTPASTLVEYRIAYLNAFFETNRGAPHTWRPVLEQP